MTLAGKLCQYNPLSALVLLYGSGRNFGLHPDALIILLGWSLVLWWVPVYPNFANPNTDPTSTTFGRITGTTSDARNWQFALKLTF